MAKYFKSFRYWLLAGGCWLLTIGSLVSSQEGSEAGDLLGQWRLAGSDTHYISFSGSVALLRTSITNRVFGNFQHVGDSLFIQCYSAEGLRSDTTMVEDSFGFKPFNNIRLKIETLDGDVLLLSKDNQKWSFYKY